eukprot:jgi/Picsp_1/3312/NSC_06151-R1_symplekin
MDSRERNSEPIDEAIDLFNRIQLAVNNEEKASLLKSLKEVVIQRSPNLAADFLLRVLELQADASPVVRRGVLDFCDAALPVLQNQESILAIARTILFLMKDTGPATVKKCIGSLFPAAKFAVLSRQRCGRTKGAQDTQSEELWEVLMQCIHVVQDLALQDDVNTGIRLSALKFMERVVILFTGVELLGLPEEKEKAGALKVLDSANSKAANEIISTLVKFLRSVKGSAGANGPLAITMIRSVSSILHARPQFAGRLVPILMAMAKADTMKVGKNSVAVALERCLRDFALLETQLALPWRSKIVKAIEQMGGVPLQQQSVKGQNTGSKRPRERDEEHDVKRITVKMEAGGENTPSFKSTSLEIQRLLQNNDAKRLFNVIENLSDATVVSVVLKAVKDIERENIQWMPDIFPVLQSLADQLIEEIRSGNFSMYGSSGNGLLEGTSKSSLLAVQDLHPPTPLQTSLLSEQERSSQKIAALKRILVTQKAPSKKMQCHLVTYLATICPESDGIEEVLISSILEDYHGRDGHEIFIQWLYKLFAEVLSTSDQDDRSEINLTGSRYEKIFESMLSNMKQSLPSSDRSIVALLNDAPALPPSMISKFIKSMLSGERNLMYSGLISARDSILQRPQCRQDLLVLVLEACVSCDEELRRQAVRMCVNQIYLYTSLDDQIESFARASIFSANIGGSEHAIQGAALFCALCTKNHALIRDLFANFGSLNEFQRNAIIINISAIAKSASDDEEFLTIVQDPPEGSNELLENAINELCCEMPSERLISSVLKCFSRKQHVKILIPVLPCIGKEIVIKVLPDIIQLPQNELPGVIRRLCTNIYSNQGAPVLEPKELLVLLHTMDQATAATLKNAMATINICLTMHEEFTAEVLAATLNQLITRIPLPPLFMRTVLQSLSSAPSLREFVVRLLDQLAAKQIWTNATQWKGWLMAVQYTAPESFQIVMRLPVDVLAKALEFFNDNFRSKLAVYASSGEIDVPDATMNLLSKYQTIR